MKKFFSLTLGVLLVVAMLISGFSVAPSSAQEPKVLHSAVAPGDFYLDPSLATWVNEILLVNMMFPGVTVNNVDTVNVEPGIASEWSASDDGKTYTFKLMDNIPWVRYDSDKKQVVEVTDDAGNVRMVTAQDVVYGINRTFDPATASLYAGTMAAFLQGGKEKLAGEDVQLGAVALDDHTVQLTAPVAAGFLAQIFGLWTFRPEPQWVIDEYGDGWSEAENIQTYGPYALKEWEHNVSATIIKNPFWPATDNMPQGTIDEFNWVWLDEPAMLAAYEAGELDWITTVPTSDLPRLKAQYPNELRIAPDTCTYFYGFNTLLTPTDNVHLRRALSMAIDREAITEITGGGEVPAGFFTRPDVPAGPDQVDYPGLGARTDPEGAKAELQAYFDDTGLTLETMPPVTLMTNQLQRHLTIAQAIQQMWQTTLGIRVQYSAQDAQTYQDTMRYNTPNVYRLGWCYDWPDASSFIDEVFHTKGPDSNNYTGYGNEAFYSLLDEAYALTDNEARKDIYAQAEDMLDNTDAAIAPIYFYTTQTMTKPYVTRTWAKDRNEHLNTWDIQPH